MGGFRVWGLGHRVLVFQVWGCGLRVQRFRVQRFLAFLFKAELKGIHCTV